MSKNRYYYYDHELCTFVEVQAERRKTLLKAAGFLMAAALLAGVITLGLDSMVGTPEEVALRAENDALQQQLFLVERRLDVFSEKLDSLSEVDQSLYRTLLDAEPISEGVRQVGVGGTDPYENFARFSVSTALLLRSSSQKLEHLEHQMNLQNASYRDLAKLAEERESWLRQMPAILPTDGPIVSGYGVRFHPILRVKKMHHGVDMVVPKGHIVAATGDGVITFAGAGGGYGKHVKVQHPETGYTTLYAHLSEIPADIKPGRKVKRGEQIGLSGNTGRSTAPHLHYEVRNEDDHSLDPLQFIMSEYTPQEYKKLREAADATHSSLD